MDFSKMERNYPRPNREKRTFQKKKRSANSVAKKKKRNKQDKDISREAGSAYRGG